ncbi:GNAT family N-acetyltransferase [Candidatus Nomurabacteria bacterium]|nr:GNAT family N-acetyltransferase [Candidatus Nomurabacteria bacterium]
MKKIEYKVFMPRESSEEVAQVIESYRDVFAASPWHEWMKCQKCDRYWGVEDRELLVKEKFFHCGEPVIDYWPRQEVLENIEKELSRESSAFLATYHNRVIGFCWGYGIDIHTMQQELNITLSPKDIEAFSRVKLAYQSDMAVLPEFRGEKIAKQLFKLRLEDMQAKGFSHGCVRVRKSPEPSQTYLWYKEKLGYAVIAEYPISDGRVILARNFQSLYNLLL